jgi:molybdate transport system substrate-binding protein
MLPLLRLPRRLAIGVLLGLLPARFAAADTVAVAGSLSPCVEELAARYAARSAGGGAAAPALVTASSGKLAAQIEAGAPYGLFLSAEVDWIERLQDEGLCLEVLPLAESPLVMWWSRPSPPRAEDLRGAGRELRVAIPDPEAAPFGRAAREYLSSLDAYHPLVAGKRLIVTATVLQAVLAVQSGGADLAFTSLSVARKAGEGSHTVLPVCLHHAGSLIRGRSTPQLEAFWAYLRSPEAEPVWRAWGFSVSGQRPGGGGP